MTSQVLPDLYTLHILISAALIAPPQRDPAAIA